jgi:hypothetical protein
MLDCGSTVIPVAVTAWDDWQSRLSPPPKSIHHNTIRYRVLLSRKAACAIFDILVTIWVRTDRLGFV